MKIYIASNYEGNPLGLLLAESKDKAEIAFYAMGEEAFSVEEIDPQAVKGISGVCFILTSTEMNSRDYYHRVGGFNFRHWKRGR